MQRNQTSITFFIIKGISDDPHLQLLIFLLVLLMYVITICGNLTILIACKEPHLHTPMYFFLGNLSIVDICCSTVSLHKILTNYISGDKRVSFFACMAQMYMFGSLEGLELSILTAMSYDRYVAICKPLQYHHVMNTGTCGTLAAACWILAFLQNLPPVGMVYSFSCYSSIEINHFFCDIIPVIRISCEDTTVVEMLFFIEGLFPIILSPFLLTFVSYIFIIHAILKIRSSSGRLKAFYTCSSHLTVVILLYTTLFSQYLTPNLSSTLESKKLFALFNTAAVPLLNPIIYSLKNKDVKRALKKSKGPIK
ncbi:olfactory receptor 8D1-like [Bufo gargarizans]|uniref:olfactory receptor 8D1-like n=1 Tax=Bufo gargarizans TaxID=30331 RepID=UPI001CF44826|nr:olfactory receptor 8D1-like [Bufo gargarizans]